MRNACRVFLLFALLLPCIFAGPQALATAPPERTMNLWELIQNLVAQVLEPLHRSSREQPVVPENQDNGPWISPDG